MSDKPKFSQRHYEVLADWLARHVPLNDDDVAWNAQMADLENTLAADNPKFDLGRFRKRMHSHFPITVIGDRDHAKAQRKAVKRLTTPRGFHGHY